MSATSANSFKKLDQSSVVSASSSSNNGWRIMERMGYVSGSGLGKNEDGRLEPVIPKQPPKKNVSVDNFAKLSDRIDLENHPIFKIINFLTRKGVISMLKYENRRRLLTIIQENPPNFDSPVHYEMKNYPLIEIPGISVGLKPDYLKNLIDFLCRQELVKKIGKENEKCFRKLIDPDFDKICREERLKRRKQQRELRKIKKQKEKMLEDARIAKLATRFSSFAVERAQVAYSNSVVSDPNSFPEIARRKSPSPDVFSLSSEKSSVNIDERRKIDILIRNFNQENQKYEEITHKQFSKLRKLLEKDLWEKMSDNMPKINLIERLSKFCCLIVCSDESTCDWLYETIEKQRIHLMDLKFSPKISMIDEKLDQNCIILPILGAIHDIKSTIESLNHQNPDLEIKSWRFLGRHASSCDQFSRLFFVIDEDRLYYQLKECNFRLFYQLGEISAQEVYSFDDILNEPDFKRVDKSLAVSSEIATSDYKLTPTANSKNGNQGILKLKIEKFGEFSGDLIGKSCSISNLEWNILVRSDKEKVGFFLQCKNGDNKPEFSYRVKGTLAIQPRKMYFSGFRRTIDHVFCPQACEQGFENFFDFQKLLDPEEGFILHGNIVFLAYFKILEEENVKMAVEQKTLQNGSQLKEMKEEVTEKSKLDQNTQIEAQNLSPKSQKIGITDKITQICRQVISDENSPLAVVISGLKAEKSQDFKQILEECLQTMVQNSDVTFVPRFVKTGQISDDQLMIVCSDRLSFVWLEKMVDQVVKVYLPSVELSLLTSKAGEKLECKISFTIPDNFFYESRRKQIIKSLEIATKEQAIDLLKNQNRRLSIDRWNFISMAKFCDQGQRQKTKFTFKIDNRSIRELISANFRLFYAFNQVFVEIVENTGI